MGRGDGGTCPVSPASGDARFPLQAGNGILSVRRDNSAAPQRRDDLRLALEAALRERKPFAQISRETGIPRSTVKREAMGRRVESTKTFYGRRFNPCVRRDGCDAAGMCAQLRELRPQVPRGPVPALRGGALPAPRRAALRLQRLPGRAALPPAQVLRLFRGL